MSISQCDQQPDVHLQGAEDAAALFALLEQEIDAAVRGAIASVAERLGRTAELQILMGNVQVAVRVVALGFSAPPANPRTTVRIRFGP